MNKKNLNYTVLKEIGFTLLAEGKTIKVKAEGFSMYPSVKPASIIYIEPIEKGTLPVSGEIIAWKRDSGLVVHRLVRIIKKYSQTYFITRGDSSAFEDELVTVDQIAGRVIRIENPGGKFVPMVSTTGNVPKYKLNKFRVWILLNWIRFRRKVRIPWS